MSDFAKSHAIAAKLKDGASPRRVRAVDNIVVACEKIIREGGKVSYSSVAEKIEALGLKGGPKAQSIYNTGDLKTLINSYTEALPAQVEARSSKASFSSDEEEIMSALGTQRLKSMFRDVLADRYKAKAEMRLLDGFVTNLKQSNGSFVAQTASQPAVIADQSSGQSEDDIAIVDRFFDVLYDYNFNLVDGEILKGKKPTGSQEFVELLQRKGLLKRN
tara:strand:+ start:2753 stop:3406 length:654 start_codon:yes stop_codon:yes gene_type:complete